MCVQLAQREEPVEEADLGDHKISEKAAGEAPDKTFDQGGIAPTPGLQKDREAEEKEDKGQNTYTWFSQPVYSAEYLASVKPRHLPPETVCSCRHCLLPPALHDTGRTSTYSSGTHGL